MIIEELEFGLLFVCFVYCICYLQLLGDELFYDVFVKQVYIVMDVEIIVIICDWFGVSVVSGS